MLRSHDVLYQTGADISLPLTDLLMNQYTNQTVKFDDLCTDFKLHEALDDSKPYATMRMDATGSITGFTYVSGSGAGLVPLTVPTASSASVSS